MGSMPRNSRKRHSPTTAITTVYRHRPLLRIQDSPPSGMLPPTASPSKAYPSWPPLKPMIILSSPPCSTLRSRLLSGPTDRASITRGRASSCRRFSARNSWQWPGTIRTLSVRSLSTLHLTSAMPRRSLLINHLGQYMYSEYLIIES